ncbi:hypothetical protein ACSYAD_36380, partial [Acaryochloris marina NIES-2412]|uniref:hypothetical protein n=1 Tax=Acaryochloris marina TaxID=155978 RepID=UPI004057FB92
SSALHGGRTMIDRTDSEDAYTNLINTLNQLGASAVYQDISTLDFNILEVPDMQWAGELLKREVMR